jgi:ATP-dependent protease ClpP protease subunit
MNTITNVSKYIHNEVTYNRPVIITVNEFTEKSVIEFSKKMSDAHNTGQHVIPIVIDSYGGIVESLLSMVSIIEQSTLPVVTIIEGKAMSCGAILFSYGEKRFMSKHARMMIHDVSSMTWGKIEDMKVDVDEAKRLNELVYGMLDKNCDQPDGYFSSIVEQKNRTDWYLSTNQAKNHNIVTHIGVPKFVCDVDVNIKLEI